MSGSRTVCIDRACPAMAGFRPKLAGAPDNPDSERICLQRVSVGLRLALSVGVSLPRQILPNEFYLITRACTQRMFLLRPDDEMNAIFEYCLAVAAAKYGILVILTCVMSNHHHTVVYDPKGTICEFCEYLHRLVAKATNALRGRRENLWSSEALSLVRLVDADDVLAKLVYAATNPVKDGLVATVADWPGVNTLDALLDGRAITVARPRYFFAAAGQMPATATLTLELPAALGEAAAFRARLREMCADVERRYAEERRREGRTVLGAAAIRAQSCFDQPTQPREETRIRPTIAARALLRRIAAISQYRVFLAAYRAARAAWHLGESCTFPAGTYWLRRFAFVAVAAT